MRRFTGVAVAGVCVLAAACAGNNSSAPAASSAKSGAGGSTTSTPPPPVAAADLPGLLLGEAEINAALGATGIAVVPPGPRDTLWDNRSQVTNKDCVVMVDPAQTSVYTGSGYVAAHTETLQDNPDLAKTKYVVGQAVVSFSSATNATSFFDASAKSWPACSNLAFDIQEKTVNGTWSVGPVSNTNGTLSATHTQEGQGGWACQRALTVRNNVAVDVLSCSYNPDDSGVNIAQQIAAKVPTQ